MDVFDLPFDSRTFAPIRPSQLIEYKEAWIFFQSVGKYNYQVHQLRAANLEQTQASAVQQARLADSNLGISYYRFANSDDKAKYNKGLALFLRQYPQYQYNLQAIIPQEV